MTAELGICLTFFRVGDQISFTFGNRNFLPSSGRRPRKGCPINSLPVHSNRYVQNFEYHSIFDMMYLHSID